MQKKFILTIAGSIIFVGIMFAVMYFNDIRFRPMRITNNTQINIANEQERLKILNKIYDTNFIFNKSSIRTAKIYIPRYAVPNKENIEFYARLFGFDNDYFENEDYYLYDNNNGTLYVDKYASYIRYEKDYTEETDEKIQKNINREKIDEDKIIEYAKKFIDEKMLNVEYEKLAINYNGQNYIVKIINDLKGYNNYAFPSMLTYSKDGELLCMDYYFFDYEIIANVDLKTMKQAYLELPIDIGDNVKVDLNSCRVVYIYEESIVQPAYLFEGEIGDGETFQCFVKAAKYDK